MDSGSHTVVPTAFAHVATSTVAQAPVLPTTVPIFVIGRFLDYKMVDSKTVVSQVQELQVILHEIHAEGIMLSKTFQVAAIIEKLCRTRENSNFRKKGKIVILIKIRNFYRSRMMKRTSPLELSHEI